MEMGELLKGLILKDRIHARWILNEEAELCFRSLLLTWRLISAVHWRGFAGARSSLCICARGCSWEHVCWLSAGRAGHTAAPRAFHCGYVGQPGAHTEVLQGGAGKELPFSNPAEKHSNSWSVGGCYLLKKKKKNNPSQLNKSQKWLLQVWKMSMFPQIISVSLVLALVYGPGGLLFPLFCYFPCSAEEVGAKDQWLPHYHPVSMAHECPLYVQNPFLSSVQYLNGTLWMSQVLTSHLFSFKAYLDNNDGMLWN